MRIKAKELLSQRRQSDYSYLCLETRWLMEQEFCYVLITCSYVVCFVFCSRYTGWNMAGPRGNYPQNLDILSRKGKIDKAKKWIGWVNLAVLCFFFFFDKISCCGILPLLKCTPRTCPQLTSYKTSFTQWKKKTHKTRVYTSVLLFPFYLYGSMNMWNVKSNTLEKKIIQPPHRADTLNPILKAIKSSAREAETKYFF